MAVWRYCVITHHTDNDNDDGDDDDDGDDVNCH